MMSTNKQRGASTPLIIIFIAMAAAILTVTFKLYPVFYENWQIENIVDSFNDEANLEELSAADIEKRFGNRLITNNIRNFNSDESVFISMDEGLLVIETDYEVRLPIYRNIDAVVKFKKLFEKKIK